MNIRTADVPGNITCIRAVGQGRRWYEPNALLNALDDVRCTGRPLRLLYEVHAWAHYHAMATVLADLRQLRRHSSQVGRCALLGNSALGSAALVQMLRGVPFAVEAYSQSERDAAIAWLLADELLVVAEAG